MFLATLSATILRLCGIHKWSYEAAAEHCNLSSRYLGDIARGKTAPSVHTLEKLCLGFKLLPNDLLIEAATLPESVFRAPLDVVQCLGYYGEFGLTTYPVCPQCRQALEREYQAFCDRCGQKLGWTNYSHATIIFPGQK